MTKADRERELQELREEDLKHDRANLKAQMLVARRIAFGLDRDLGELAALIIQRDALNRQIALMSEALASVVLRSVPPSE
jgi:hypothetical protein